MTSITMEGPVCPLPLTHADRIMLGHGSGGRMSHTLITEVFQKYLNGSELSRGNDYAELRLSDARIAITTDSHIVKPLFFPGGDIGRLAVCGTVNDLAASGAQPLALTAGFILEEGLPVETLERILASMAAACREAGVEMVAGDTKVAEKGNCDGVFINTTGIGVIPNGRQIDGSQARPGDAILVSGTLADHGIAVVSARGELGLENDIQSDTAPMNGLVEALLAEIPEVHVLRDPTRGGLATALNEICTQSGVGMLIQEANIPVRPAVAAACEMLGFDPLYVANEGKMIVILPDVWRAKALALLRGHPLGKEAMYLGQVTASERHGLLMRTTIGGTRIIDSLAGEILPRIC